MCYEDEQALLLTSIKTPAIPAWHEPCSSPYFCLQSARENKPQIISLCARASIYWSLSCIPYGASQSPNPIQEESRGRVQTKRRGATQVLTKRPITSRGRGAQCSQVTKILSLDLCKMHCQYGPMQSVSGFFTTAGSQMYCNKGTEILTWKNNSGAKIYNE